MQTLLLTRGTLTLDTTGEQPILLLLQKLHEICSIDFHEILLPPDVRYIKAKMHQIRFRLRLRPRPRWGAYSAPPDLLDGGEGSWLLAPQDPPPALGPLGLAASVRAWTFFTGCAVAQHCYNGDVSFLREKWKL